MQTLQETLDHANRSGWPVLYSGNREDWLVFGAYGPDEFSGWAAPEAARQIIGGAVIEEFATPGAPIQYVLVNPDDAEAIARAEALMVYDEMVTGLVGIGGSGLLLWGALDAQED